MYVNNENCIPMPKLIYHKGVQVYARVVSNKDFMRKFQGFGLSLSVLKHLDKTKDIIFIYLAKGKEIKYKSSIRAFLDSELAHNNAGKDWQKFVPIKQMGVIKNKIDDVIDNG